MLHVTGFAALCSATHPTAAAAVPECARAAAAAAGATQISDAGGCERPLTPAAHRNDTGAPLNRCAETGAPAGHPWHVNRHQNPAAAQGARRKGAAPPAALPCLALDQGHAAATAHAAYAAAAAAAAASVPASCSGGSRCRSGHRRPRPPRLGQPGVDAALHCAPSSHETQPARGPSPLSLSLLSQVASKKRKHEQLKQQQRRRHESSDDDDSSDEEGDDDEEDEGGSELSDEEGDEEEDAPLPGGRGPRARCRPRTCGCGRDSDSTPL